MIIAVIIPIVLLSGCGKSLTVEEYKDELQSKWRDYASAQNGNSIRYAVI